MKYNTDSYIVYINKKRSRKNHKFTERIGCVFVCIAVTRLMGGSGGPTGMNMSNMSMSAALSSCAADSKPMQFPLAQRRKRRVLFTQAQVMNYSFYYYYSYHSSHIHIFIYLCMYVCIGRYNYPTKDDKILQAVRNSSLNNFSRYLSTQSLFSLCNSNFLVRFLSLNYLYDNLKINMAKILNIYRDK